MSIQLLNSFWTICYRLLDRGAGTLNSIIWKKMSVMPVCTSSMCRFQKTMDCIFPWTRSYQLSAIQMRFDHWVLALQHILTCSVYCVGIGHHVMAWVVSLCHKGLSNGSGSHTLPLLEDSDHTDQQRPSVGPTGLVFFRVVDTSMHSHLTFLGDTSYMTGTDFVAQPLKVLEMDPPQREVIVYPLDQTWLVPQLKHQGFDWIKKKNPLVTSDWYHGIPSYHGCIFCCGFVC